MNQNLPKQDSLAPNPLDQNPLLGQFPLPSELRLPATWAQRLITAAVAAREQAYAPFSRFRVGAALLTGELAAGEPQIFVGCNVENASYGATICAERVAGGAAIAAGQRVWSGMAIATRGGAAPCGLCRQFLVEFAPHMEIILFDVDQRTCRRRVLADLLPDYFRGADVLSE
jgi:cytidine deaminase